MLIRIVCLEAIDHWDLITYQETYLLVDDHLTAQETKQEVALIVTHQRFGNLVVSSSSSSSMSPRSLDRSSLLDDGMVERSLIQTKISPLFHAVRFDRTSFFFSLFPVRFATWIQFLAVDRSRLSRIRHLDAIPFR